LVTSLGHRVKLLDAIAALRNDENVKAPSVDTTSTLGAPSTQTEDRAERRQVTVMFSDLVGSTALSARMDPEDLREVISAYQKCVAETVDRCWGFVAKFMGDGVLIYFGYPQAPRTTHGLLIVSPGPVATSIHQRDAAPQAFQNVSKKFIRLLQFIPVHLVHNDPGYEQELSSALWSLSFLCRRNMPSNTLLSKQKSIEKA
jgi:class 3 adenylate cyclase